MPTALDDDEALLERWRRGDAAAGNALLEGYFGRLYRFFEARVEGGVEDLIQHTLLRCLENRERLRAATTFRAYVYRLARNQLYDHRVAQKQGDARHGVLPSGLRAGGPSPSTAMRGHDQRDAIRAAVRSLPEDLRIVIELHYWEDLSATELAEVLEIPSGTVKSRIRRAREQLAEALRAQAWTDDRITDTLQRLGPAVAE